VPDEELDDAPDEVSPAEDEVEPLDPVWAEASDLPGMVTPATRARTPVAARAPAADQTVSRRSSPAARSRASAAAAGWLVVFMTSTMPGPLQPRLGGALEFAENSTPVVPSIRPDKLCPGVQTKNSILGLKVLPWDPAFTELWKS
jgi:hypothetical protein